MGIIRGMCPVNIMILGTSFEQHPYRIFVLTKHVLVTGSVHLHQKDANTLNCGRHFGLV